ncbi:neuronal acetylcholine receptor subunit beta-3-like isoform X2 [Convolutriloba macropyga]|uniref:neuronal acetylcholine receptor subunit beta-3-like isoform X2 n=1 Tax=Convolutriloba macropyga TaxID=536237 RepID=UPI003F52459C
MSNCNFLVIYFTVLSWKILVSNGSNYTNGVQHEQNILEHLSRVLPQSFPPDDLLNKSVFVFADLNQISEVNEKEGYLTVQLWVYAFYYSPSAYWNTSETGWHYFVTVPTDTYWSADIVPLDATQIKYQSYNRQVVYNFGMVLFWTSMVTMNIACSFDITSFPFDKHQCDVRIGSWVSDRQIFQIQPYIISDGMPLEFYQENDAWDLEKPVHATLTSRTWDGESIYDIVEFHLKLRRRHLFHILIFVIPNSILYLLSGLVFIIPVESGEKISYAITILLAQFVSLGMIYDLLPPSSLTFPRVGYFCEAAICHMAIDVLFTILVVKFHFYGTTHKMSAKLRNLLQSRAMPLFGLKPFTRSNVREPHQFDHTYLKEAISNSTGSNNSITPLTISKKLSEVENKFQNADKKAVIEQDSQSECKFSEELIWNHFARFLDRLFLYTHMVISIFVIMFAAFY